MAPLAIYVVADRPDPNGPLDRLGLSITPVIHVRPASFIEIAPRLRSGCVVIDVQNGHRFFASLTALDMSIPAIIIVDSGDVQAAVFLMKQGASDVFERPVGEHALYFAVDRALHDAAPTGCMREEIDAMRRVANLSRREHQVLNAITAGKSSKTMAYELGISVRTIEVHRARMLQRLGVPNIAKAIRLAIMAELRTTAP
jgi:two-component system response regulator FixJ